MNRSHILSALVALAALSGQTEAATPPTYSVTDLGPIAPANQLSTASVVGISNTGLVLVNGFPDGALLYWTDGSGRIEDLSLDPRLPTVCRFTAPFSPLGVFAAGISRNGNVVATVIPQAGLPGEPHCIAVLHAGTWTYRETLGYKDGATGVNNAGQVIGNFGALDEGFGPGCNFPLFTTADAINDLGQIAGTSIFDGFAVLCTAGVFQVLPNVPGGMDSGANAINNNGDLVGDTFVSDALHGFFYRAGKTVDLGTLPGAPYTSPQCINIHDQIVGTSFSATGFTTTFLYQGGAMFDLLQLIAPTDPYRGLGIQLSGISCINDHGVIVSAGTLLTGDFHLFLLTPNSAAKR